MILIVIQFRGHHERRRARGRGRRALHPGRHAGKRWRSTPISTPARSLTPGPGAPRGDRPGGGFYGAMTGARNSSRATRWPGGAHHAINLIGGIVVRRRAAEDVDRRRGQTTSRCSASATACAPDPGAAHLGGHRHHRHPLGVGEGPRHRTGLPGPQQRRRPSWPARDLRLSRWSRAAQAALPDHRRPAVRHRPRAQDVLGSARPKPRPRRPRQRRPSPRRATRPSRRMPAAAPTASLGGASEPKAAGTAMMAPRRAASTRGHDHVRAQDRTSSWIRTSTTVLELAGKTDRCSPRADAASSVAWTATTPSRADASSGDSALDGLVARRAGSGGAAGAAAAASASRSSRTSLERRADANSRAPE